MVGMIRMLMVAMAALLLCGATTLPVYDESADAHADIRAATARAAAEKKDILLIFGANWCVDCRELSANMAKSPLADLIERRYVVVKVDVGNWNRNLDIVKAWGDPIAKGNYAWARIDGRTLVVNVFEVGDEGQG